MRLQGCRGTLCFYLWHTEARGTRVCVCVKWMGIHFVENKTVHICDAAQCFSSVAGGRVCVCVVFCWIGCRPSTGGRRCHSNIRLAHTQIHRETSLAIYFITFCGNQSTPDDHRWLIRTRNRCVQSMKLYSDRCVTAKKNKYIYNRNGDVQLIYAASPNGHKTNVRCAHKGSKYKWMTEECRQRMELIYRPISK